MHSFVGGKEYIIIIIIVLVEYQLVCSYDIIAGRPPPPRASFAIVSFTI